MTTAVSITLADLRQSLGQVVARSDWFLVTAENIRAFAEATGDEQWIHVDEERARRDSPYGTTIAHGFLTLSLLSHLLKQTVEIGDAKMAINYGLNRVRFPSPVIAGTRIRASFTLASLKEIDGGTEAVFNVVIEGERTEKPVCVAEWIIRYYK